MSNKSPQLYRSKLAAANHGNESSHETEIQQMIWINGGGRIDLQAVVPIIGILEQAVHWV